MTDLRDDNKNAGVLPLIAEEASVSKRDVVTGRVDVRTVTDTVDQLIQTTVQGQTVEVTRVPVDRQVDVAPLMRTEGDLTIIPILEEIVVVEKRLVLKEEIHIKWIVQTEDIETHVPLRRQRAVVERHEAGHTSDTPDPITKESKQ